MGGVLFISYWGGVTKLMNPAERKRNSLGQPLNLEMAIQIFLLS